MIGYIYKISSPSCDEIYVGSTCLPLKLRFALHKTNAVGCSARKILQHDDATIECIQEVEIVDKHDIFLKQTEKECLLSLRAQGCTCVNLRIPYRTNDDRKAYIREYQRNRYHSMKNKSIAICIQNP
jgi:hypothetical protein